MTEGRGMQTHRIEQTTSTTDLARAAIEAGQMEQPAIWVAGSETAARGRRGRKWHAPEGGLWLTGAWPGASPPGLSVCIGGAVAMAIENAIGSRGDEGARVQLKWPNDILIDGAKVCGILCESIDDRGGRPILMVGVGINVNIDLEPIVREVDQPITSLMKVTRRQFELIAVEQAVIEALTGTISDGVTTDALQQAASLLYGIDQVVEIVDANGNKRSGVLVGLSGHGHPLIDSDGWRRPLQAGALLVYPERQRA